MSRGAIATINLSALQHNLAVVKQHAPSSKILAMVKSRAYGHGLVEVARAFAKADALGVACVEEAVILREAGIKQPIVAISGFLDAAEIPTFEKYNLTAALHCEEQFKSLPKNLSIWLNIDSGMHRLGFPLDQAPALIKKFKPEVVMTHLAKADVPESDYTNWQVQRFNSAVSNFNLPLSIANSAAIIAFPETHREWVRPGIMLYGVSPYTDKVAADFNLKPAMTLTAKLIAIHDLKKGDQVGYGGDFTCPQDMRVGVAAIGYGDGYPRHAKTGMPVLVNDQCCALVGRVSMDLITIDLRNASNPKVDDVVTLWGDKLPVETIAQQANTIAYQLLCGVSSRVRYCYK